MRARFILLILAIVLVAGFAAQNWPEFMRPSTLNFGLFQMEAPLGAVMLGLLGVVLLLYLISTATLRSRMLLTENRYTRDIQVQRDLADKAEASRFTELRQYLDSHFRDARHRDPLISTEFEKSMVQSQRELRAQLEQLGRSLESRLSNLEGRVALRGDRLDPSADLPRERTVERTVEKPADRPVDMPTPPRDQVRSERVR
jgi:hypothetical protein